MGMDDSDTVEGKQRIAQVAEQQVEYAALTPKQLAKRIQQMENAMHKHAQNLEFEEAAKVRDQLESLRNMALGPHTI
jgi:excinuclease ABC subunit B